MDKNRQRVLERVEHLVLNLLAAFNTGNDRNVLVHLPLRSKNNCLKNYCECRKNGLPCTPLCKCEGCKNHKIDIAPELAKKLCRRKSRKKKKIVFKAENNKKLDFTQQLLPSKPQK